MKRIQKIFAVTMAAAIAAGASLSVNAMQIFVKTLTGKTITLDGHSARSAASDLCRQAA